MRRLLSNVLRHAVQAPDAGAFAPSAPEDSAARCQALLDAARERLRSAHAKRDAAARDLRAAEERLRRALEVIEESSSADQASDEAERAARAASQAWAARGCPDCEEPDGALLDAAARAHNAAVDARLRADGAREAIPGLEGALDSARSALASAESGVRDAVRALLVARAEPQFVAMERAALEFDGARREVEGLAKMLAGRRNEFAGGAAALLERLARSMPEPPRRESTELIYDGRDLDSDSWLAFARRLVEDPNAKE